MNQEQFREFYERNFYYILFADIALGLVIGLIPLILGIRRKKRNLGILAFISCGLAGGFTPILSIVIAAVFTILMLRKSPGKKAVLSDEISNSGASE